MQIFQYIGKIFVTLAVGVASLFGITQTANDNVGAVIPVSVAVFQTSLQSSISASATSMTLVSGTNKAGNSLSGYTCFNIDEGTATEEFVCGTASGTAVTSMIRGIDPVDGDLEVTALKKAHRRGASVKVTNYPSLGILSRILNGNETLPNPISYASGVGPLASSDLTDKEYVLSVVSGGSVSFEKVVVSGTAGETLSAGNLIYLKSSDGRWWQTDADTASTVENVTLGIAQGSGTAGASISGGVLVKGIDTNQSGLSANTIYYASNTAGALSSSAGTKEVTIGIAISTTSIVFAPRYNQNITEDEQDALAGTGGTPSASNKFVTATGLTTSLADTATLPVVRTYTTPSTAVGSPTTQFDVTNPSGTTFRYTWDSTGTDPVINTTTFPTSSQIYIYSPNFSAANNGSFIVTSSGTDYFEVTNASGVAEVNKILSSDGYLKVLTLANRTWTKPAGLKYAIVEVQGAGASGGNTTAGTSSTFKSLTAAGGSSTLPTASGGDLNINGRWGAMAGDLVDPDVSSAGGNSVLGSGGAGGDNSYNGGAGTQGGGGGGSGATSSSGTGYKGGSSGSYTKKLYAASALSSTETLTVGIGGYSSDPGANNNNHGAGGDGIVIVTEYYQ